MPALTEFEPLRVETIDTIRARIDGNVNAGLDPADARWQDTVEGGWFFDHTQSFALEEEGLWDYVSVELPASFFLPFSWGIYLDYWGEMLDVPRNPPVAATGIVTLTNTTTEDIPVASGLEVAVPATDPALDPLSYTTTETVIVLAGADLEVPVEASEQGAEWNVAAHAVAQVTGPVSGITVDNADAITGGADEELDEPYKARLLLEFTGTRGGGTIDDYIAETLEVFPTVGFIVVEPAWTGPNTVRLIISDHDAQPLAAPVVAEIQAYWDTHAPIDAIPTVATVAVVDIAVAADLELTAGYSLDGVGGSVAVRADLDLALADFFHSLPAGADVLHNRVLATLLAVEGVYDVTALTLDPGTGPVAGDVAVADLDSAQLAGPGDYTASLAP
jgi:uncharacterized phage protein gp47/JayE